jgi:hypothetical protein
MIGSIESQCVGQSWKCYSFDQYKYTPALSTLYAQHSSIQEANLLMDLLHVVLKIINFKKSEEISKTKILHPVHVLCSTVDMEKLIQSHVILCCV